MFAEDLEQSNVARATERDHKLALKRVAAHLAAGVRIGFEDSYLLLDRVDRSQRQVEFTVLHRKLDEELLKSLQVAHRFAPAVLLFLRSACIRDSKRPRMPSRTLSAT